VLEKKDSWRQVAIYLLLVFSFSSVFYFLILRAHSLGAEGGLRPPFSLECLPLEACIRR